MASASLARAGFLRSGSYQPRNMASSCGVSPPHPERRVVPAMVPEHTFFYQKASAYVRRTKRVAAPPQEEGRWRDVSTRQADYALPCRLAVLPSCRLAVLPSALWITVGKSGDKWRSRWISGTMHLSPIPVQGLRESPAHDRVRL